MLCCSCILWDERKSNGWKRREEDKFRERVRVVKKLFSLTSLKDKKWFSLTSLKDQIFLFSVWNLVTVMTYVAFCSLLFGFKKDQHLRFCNNHIVHDHILYVTPQNMQSKSIHLLPPLVSEISCWRIRMKYVKKVKVFPTQKQYHNDLHKNVIKNKLIER